MPDHPTPAEQREATHVLGEMAASRLFALIHERLEELQSCRPFTQAELASRLGTSEQNVSRWLTEPRNMTVRTAGRLLGALEAHLLFELDRFEDIGSQSIAGNGALAPLKTKQPQVVISTTGGSGPSQAQTKPAAPFHTKSSLTA
jgi:transcriptional regulator with XRE-family HTH domain